MKKYWKLKKDYYQVCGFPYFTNKSRFISARDRYYGDDAHTVIIKQIIFIKAPLYSAGLWELYTLFTPPENNKCIEIQRKPLSLKLLLKKANSNETPREYLRMHLYKRILCVSSYKVNMFRRGVTLYGYITS